MEGQGQLKVTGKTTDTQSGDSRKTTQHHVAVNMLCIIGATIGLAAIFLPWLGWKEGLWECYNSIVDIIAYNVGDFTDWGFVGVVLFTAGTLLAFVFPLAGIIQSSGLALFYLHYQNALTTWPQNLGYEFELSMGFFFGALSSAVILASLLVPIGPGCDMPRGRWMRRTDVVARMNEAEGHIVRQSPGSPRDLFRTMVRERRWAAAWLVTALLLLPLIYINVPAAYDRDVVIGSTTGVTIQSSNNLWGWGFTGGHMWNSTRIRMSDGVGEVNWSTDYTVWGGGALTPAALGVRNLSGLQLELTVIDWSGEGCVSYGDLMTLIPVSGSNFQEGVAYRLSVILDYGGSGGLTPFRANILNFEFDGDEITSALTQSVFYGGYVIRTSIIIWDPRYHEDEMVAGALTVLGITAAIGAAYYGLVRPRLVRMQ